MQNCVFYIAYIETSMHEFNMTSTCQQYCQQTKHKEDNFYSQICIFRTRFLENIKYSENTKEEKLEDITRVIRGPKYREDDNVYNSSSMNRILDRLFLG